MEVAGIEVELIQKDIKNIHLAVYPPDGRVRLAAPRDVNTKTLELYVMSKIPWIRKQQRKFIRMDRPSPRQYLDRESHYLFGKRYLLRVHETDHPYRYPRIEIRSKDYIEMYVKEDFDEVKKAELLKEWYRAKLKDLLTELVPKWEKVLGVQSNQVKVHTMKTKWGSCNTENGNVLFNIELAKKSVDCIEYVVVHELLHLIERNHNDNFKALLKKHVPTWEDKKSRLNAL
jgi:predicted metal-dependent hydrolase